MTMEKNTNRNDELVKAKVVPYSDTDRMSALLKKAEKMRLGSWKDFFSKENW